MVKALKKSVSFPFFYRLYADDLVVVLKEKVVDEFLLKFKLVSLEYQLILNCKKCAALAIGNPKKTIEEAKLHGIPLAKSYKFLGVVVNNKGSIQDNLVTIKRKINHVRVQA